MTTPDLRAAAKDEARRLTKQEQLFLDRLAAYLVEANSAEAVDAQLMTAADMVTRDDRRLVHKIVGSAEFKAAGSRHIADRIFSVVRESRTTAADPAAP